MSLKCVYPGIRFVSIITLKVNNFLLSLGSSTIFDFVITADQATKDKECDLIHFAGEALVGKEAGDQWNKFNQAITD